MSDEAEKGLLESFQGVVKNVKSVFAKPEPVVEAEPAPAEPVEEPPAEPTEPVEPGKEPRPAKPEGETEEPDPYDIKADDVISVDGKTYTAKELIANHENKENWSKTNTTEAQKISSDREALKNTVVVSNARKEALDILAEDPTLIDMVVSQLEKAGKTDAVEKFKAALAVDDSNVVNPYLEEVTALQEKDTKRELVAQYIETKNNFQDEYKLTKEIVDKVETACAAHMQKTDQHITLEHMYLRMKEKGEIVVTAPADTNKPVKKLRVPPTLKNPAGGRQGEEIVKPKATKSYKRDDTYGLTAEDFNTLVK